MCDRCAAVGRTDAHRIRDETTAEQCALEINKTDRRRSDVRVRSNAIRAIIIRKERFVYLHAAADGYR